MYIPCYHEGIHTLYFVEESEEPTGERDCFGGRLNVFVCGGLQAPARMVPLMRRPAPFAPGVVKGYLRRQEEVGHETYFFMVPDERDAQRLLTGIVWLDLSADEIERIETFELKNNVRRRIQVQVTVGDRIVEAVTYVKR